MGYFICHADFMMYRARWVPVQTVFASVYERRRPVIRVGLQPLHDITLADVLVNGVLPYLLTYSNEVHVENYIINLEYWAQYICNVIYPKLCNYGMAHIGTIDFSVYQLLVPLLPIGYVHHLGHISGPRENAITMAKRKASREYYTQEYHKRHAKAHRKNTTRST